MVENDRSDISDVPEPSMEPEDYARCAGLTYVSDSDPGIRRKPWGRGFTYLDPSGDHIRDDDLRERIDRLAIPPAWTDVWICPDPAGHLQATGRDDAGRKQYIYHPEWERVRNEGKFARTIEFGAALPQIRERAERDLRKRRLSFEKVLGAVVFLLDRTLIRVGNKTYAAENGSFGLTTLRDRHVDFTGTRCTFEFAGKRGKKHTVVVDDQRLARVVRRCREVPGYDLFQYYGDGEERDRIDSTDVNEYLKRISGRDFTAKDFRTWGASVRAAVYLYEQRSPKTDRDAERHVVEMVKHVAEHLGNTPAVCRAYYIHPQIGRAYLGRDFRDRFQDGLSLDPHPHLDREERALLHFFGAQPERLS